MSPVQTALHKLDLYLEHETFKGYDCYDALNSPLLSTLGVTKFFRTIFIQSMKRSPINFRPALGIRKDYNPKGLGLFISASCQRYKKTGDQKYLDRISNFVELLKSSQSPGYSGSCWGYNFDWQSRVFFLPKYTPTVVNTAYIGHAFLDAYEITHEKQFLNIARSSCDFILNDLYRTHSGDTFCFSYTPLDKTMVHNANTLGAGLLARVYSFTQEVALLEVAQKAFQYTADRQNEDGSWFYGEGTNQKWIDNFHTAFVLECFDHFQRAANSSIFSTNLQKGYDFFLKNFFLENGCPKYYSNRTYPIDIHSCAQAIITLSKMDRLNNLSTPLLISLTTWTIQNMFDAKGYFYFQKTRYFTNKIAYIRWSQAWMYYALSFLDNETH